MKERENKLREILEKFSKELPHFPDGRIDYTHAKLAPVITVFVCFEGQILLLKRSDKVGAYKNKWNAVAGFLDEVKPIEEKIKEELHEELGISLEIISLISLGEPYEYIDTAIGKTWLINPVLVTLSKKLEIKLDWEHTDFQWIDPIELKNFDSVPGLEKSYEYAHR